MFSFYRCGIQKKSITDYHNCVYFTHPLYLFFLINKTLSRLRKQSRLTRPYYIVWIGNLKDKKKTIQGIEIWVIKCNYFFVNLQH